MLTFIACAGCPGAKWFGTGLTRIVGDWPLVPSPGTPGVGEGDLVYRRPFDTRNHPHPSPLPEYRARGIQRAIANFHRRTQAAVVRAVSIDLSSRLGLM